MAMADEIRFDGRAILVTGAGRGLGRAAATLLASRGAHVVVADNGAALDGSAAEAGPAHAVVAEIAAAGGRAVPCTEDLGTEAGASAAVGAALDAFGRIDGIVHCASPCPDLKAAQDISTRDLDLVMRVNPFAALWMARAAWPHMMAQGGGHLVFMPSAALFGAPRNTDYAAAKAALIGVVRCLAIEGAEYGIRVNGVSPSAARRMTEGFLPPAYAEWFLTRMPPEKVAVGLAWLVSDACQVSGEILAMGGGRIARMALAEAEGVIGESASIEEVDAAMPRVLADASFFHPRDLADRSAKVAALLGFGRGTS
jgi:NAD(P)-dependent dehydrogenase (short-subunit alcohol dehydrogenase family)